MASITLSTRLGGVRPGLDLSLDSHRFLTENRLLWPASTKLDLSPFQLFRYFPSKTYDTMKKHWLNMCAITSKLMDEYRVRMKARQVHLHNYAHTHANYEKFQHFHVLC